MSKAQLDKFIGLVSNDPAVLQEASKDEQDAQKFVQNVVEYAKTHGYEFTEEEAKEWIGQQAQPKPEGELTDTQLEMVAGGKTPATRQFLGQLTGFLDARLRGPAPGRPPIIRPSFPQFGRPRRP